MNIYAGTYGVVINMYTGQNLTTTTALELKIKSPAGVTVTKSLTVGNIISPRSTGKVFYTVEQGDFPVKGKYKLQLFDTTPGRRLASPIVNIDVKESLS
jgi:hypothetical protein